MAISVEGYGAITQSNAPEIYKAWRRGDIELNAAQQHKVESLVPDDVRYEIDNEQGVAHQDGKNQLGDDVKNAESHGGQGGNAAGCTAGNMASVVGTTLLAKVALAAPGFVAVLLGAAAVACAAASLIFTKLFDNGYDDRVKAQGNAESMNQTIDANTQALEDSMSAMDDDAENYNDANAELTLKMNGHVSKRAALEDQLATAQMGGDKAEVERIKGELDKLKEIMIADEEGGGLEDILKNIDEYRTANEQASGVRDGGQSVSDFLKEGTPLGVVATINAVLLTAAGVAMLATALGHMPKLAPFFVDAPASAIAKVMYGACGVLFGMSALKMSQKAIKEFECGSSGGDMQSHINDLGTMLPQQEAYVETNLEGYEKSDEDEQKDRDKAKDQAEGSKTGVGSKGPQPNPNKPNDPNKGNGNGDGDGDK